MNQEHYTEREFQADLQENGAASTPLDRRNFIVKSAAATGVAATAAGGLLSTWIPSASSATQAAQVGVASTEVGQVKSIIGAYGSWASQLPSSPARLSWLRPENTELTTWRTEARAKVLECLSPPDLSSPAPKSPADPPQPVTPVVTRRSTHDGLLFEEIEWAMPCGLPTQAVVIKPADATGRLPGILALHDHGGKKYFGLRKIVDLPGENHPLMLQHRIDYYEGRAWANEFARRGYVVLVHDVFAFGSRRVLYGDMSEIPWGGSSTRGKSDASPELEENIATYNTWGAEHEDVMSKSLLCAGTTWPGVVLSEDRRALDVLAARDDVDPQQLGCAGLSGGGLRTVYLAGIDDRVRCANCVGFMSTWRDFLMSKAYTHTWMTYAPLLPQYLDFPEILGLRVPLPTLVQSCTEDSLYTLPEMERADRLLRAVFAKAGAAERYRGEFYGGGHKFDVAMQENALTWFDRWLKE